MPSSSSSTRLPPEPPVHVAARRGDLAELERLAGGGADLDARMDLFGYGGVTPLMVAACSLDGAGVETLRWLLEHGADLHAASYARWLLEHGADLHLQSEDGVTAAWYAAGPGYSREPLPAGPKGGLIERLRFLLDTGLDARESRSNGRSLLTEAALAGDPERVKLLLERGADPDPGSGRASGQAVNRPRAESEKNRAGERKFITNAREWIAERRRPNPFADQPSSFKIPLFCAAASGSAACVRLLLAAGVLPDTVDREGATALFHSGSPEAARALLEAGADPQVVDRRDYDPLQEVIEEESTQGVRRSDRFGIARLLVEAGADLERRDGFGHRRLYSCAFRRAADAVEWLLEAGAAPLAAQEKGRMTPLDAVCWQHEHAELAPAAERIIDLLIKAGIPVDQPDGEGWRPIHHAAAGDGGHATAIRALLKHGALPDPPGRKGITPLWSAAHGGEVECSKILLEAGADPLRKDEEGRTPLDRARAHHQLSMSQPQYDRALREAAESLRLIEAAAGGKPI